MPCGAVRRSKISAVKDVAKQVIDALPDAASMEDIIQALYVPEKFQRGLREVREGKGIPHEEVKRQMQK